MKICHLTSVHTYKDTRIFYKECASLSKAGFEVHLVAPDAPNNISNGIHLHGLFTKTNNRFLRMTKVVAEVYKKAIQIDANVYHFHDPELIPVGLLLKLKGKKVIYDVHEDYPREILSKYWIPKIFRWFISTLFEWFENNSSKIFDVIITATPHINNRFLKLGCNAININNYPILSELYMPENNIQKENVVCYVGSITEVRGIYQMVKALEYTNVKLLLGGMFSPPSLKEKIVQNDGWKSIIYLGYLSREDIKKVLSVSLAGLVVLNPEPNHLNSQPNKLFEYMSAGIPVIASNFPLWKEILEENNCGICVNPFDPKEIADAINWVVNHPREASEMGKRGRELIIKKYNWEKESLKLIKTYQNLL